MDIADWKGFPARRRDGREARQASRPRPRQLRRILDRRAARAGAHHGAAGTRAAVDVVIGTQPAGQGHETSFAQVVSDLLHVPVESVRIILGDTDVVRMGGGTHSGRSMRHAATVFAKAAVRAHRQGQADRCHRHGVGAGERLVRRRPFRRARHQPHLRFSRTRERGRTRTDCPSALQDGLAIVTDNEMHDPVFPNGTAICEVEIDPRHRRP